MGENRNYNYGIALLRMLMCFEVVVSHCWIGSVSIYSLPFYRLRGLAVPVFMFLSFYYSAKYFSTIDYTKTKKRIWRVVYPQIGWAIIYWIVLIILQIRMDITFTDLLWQIVSGHSPKLNPSMWFQTVLIALTFVFILIFSLIKIKKGLLILFFLTLVSLFFQYSGYNLILFDSLRYELKSPLGRFSEMIPYASLGYLVAHYNLFNRLKTKRKLCLITFGIISLILSLYKLIPTAPGFGYSNNNNLLVVFFAAGFAYLLPFERVSEKSRNILKYVTRYTLGIYCMHRLVGEILSMIRLELTGLIRCVIIYIIAFFISFIMCKLSSKYLKQLVE